MAENRCQSTVTIQQNDEVSSFLGPTKEEPGQCTDLHRMCENEQFVELGKNIKTIPPFQECQQDNSTDLHHTYIKKEPLETETVKVAGPSVSGSLDIRTIQNVGTQAQQRNIQNPSIKLSPQSPGPAHSSQDKTDLPVQPAQTSIHMLMFPKCSPDLLFSTGLPATQNKTQSCQRPLPTQPAQAFRSEETETKHSLQGLQIQKNYLPMQNMATNLDETAIGIIKQENEGMQYNFSTKAQIPLDTVVSSQLTVGRLHDLRNQLLLNAPIQSSPSTALTESDIVSSKQKSNEGKNIACHLVIDSVQSAMSSAVSASHFVFSNSKTICLKRKNVTCSSVSNLPKKVRTSSYMTNSNIVGESGVARSTVNIPTGQRNSSMASSPQKVKRFPCTNKAIKVDLTGGGLLTICIECNQPLSTPYHAVLKNCDLCPFSTICSSSLCGHLKYEHGLKLKLPKELNSGYNFLMECSLSERMICVCHKMWTKCCNVIETTCPGIKVKTRSESSPDANHLSECTMSKGRKTCILVSESPDRSQQTENVMDFRVNETENSDQNNAIKLECFEVADNTENQGILTEIQDILTADYTNTELVPWQQQSEKQNDTISEWQQDSGEHGLPIEIHEKFVCEGQNKTLPEDSLSENQNDFVFEKLQQSLTENQQESLTENQQEIVTENQQESAGHVSVTNKQKLHISESHTNVLFESQPIELECGICGEKFKRIGLLSQHINSFHNKKNKHKVVMICMLCDTHFVGQNKQSSIRRHQIRVHDGKHIIYEKFEVGASSYTFKEYVILRVKCSKNKIDAEFKMMYDKALKELSVKGLTSENLKIEFNEITHVKSSRKSTVMEFNKITNAKSSQKSTVFSNAQNKKKFVDQGSKFIEMRVENLLDKGGKSLFCNLCDIELTGDIGESRICIQTHFYKHWHPEGIYVGNQDNLDLSLEKEVNAFLRQKIENCNFCNRNLCRTRFMATHLKMFHINIKCNTCGKLVLKKSFDTHLQSHEENANHQCDKCGRLFKNKLHFKYHKNTTCNFVKCEICSLVLGKRNFKKHLRNHENKQAFQCLECGKRFNCPENRQMHVRYVHRRIGCNLVCCHVCGKQLKQIELRKHLKKCHGSSFNAKSEIDKKFECFVCNKNYTTLEILKRHMKLKHTDRNNHFVCFVCGKLILGSATKHIETHNEPSPRFHCEVCNKDFKGKFHLNCHMSTVHATKKYTCRYCGKQYPLKYHCERHEKATHLKQKNVQCTLCNYKCYESNMLKSHMKFRHKTVTAKPSSCDKETHQI